MKHREEKWTEEPWSKDDLGLGIWQGKPFSGMRVCDIRGWGYLTGGGTGALGLAHDEAEKIQHANADRIVACVNGCTGLNPEAFADLAKSHTELLRIIEENRMVGLNQGSEYVPHIAAALSAEMRVHAKGEAR